MKNHGRPDGAIQRTWQAIAFAAYALLLGACATGSAGVSATPDEAPKPTAAAAVPDRRLVRTVRAGFEPRLCSIPSDSLFFVPKSCTRLLAGSEVIQNQRVSSLYAAYYHVVHPNGMSGYIREDEFLRMDDDRTRDLLRAKAPSCARSGDVSVGMTRELVALCWGEPRRIVRTESRSGVREKLIYRRGTVFMLNDVVDRVRTVE